MSDEWVNNFVQGEDFDRVWVAYAEDSATEIGRFKTRALAVAAVKKYANGLNITSDHS